MVVEEDVKAICELANISGPLHPAAAKELRDCIADCLASGLKGGFLTQCIACCINEI